MRGVLLFFGRLLLLLWLGAVKDVVELRNGVAAFNTNRHDQVGGEGGEGVKGKKGKT